MLRAAPRRPQVCASRPASCRAVPSAPASALRVPARCFATGEPPSFHNASLRVNPKDMLDGMDTLRRLYRKHRPGRELTTEGLSELYESEPEFARAVSSLLKKDEDIAAEIGTGRRPPVRVAVTGATGNIGYALLFRIASGAMLGPDQPVILQLLELPQAMGALDGVHMELEDGAFPLLDGVVKTTDARVAFQDVDYALLVGAKPRSPGEERKDLMVGNARIFQEQGAALNDVASPKAKVLVVGNPANTNALIASHHAPRLPPSAFAAMTRLDHNRGLAQLSQHLRCRVDELSRFAVWGNHSPSMFPDVAHLRLRNAAPPAISQEWLESKFIPTVAQRGGAVLAARKLSSAASAASAAVDHMRLWAKGSEGQWTSAAVRSQGEYGSTPGVFFSFPVIVQGGAHHIVPDLPISEFARARLAATDKELVAERDAVAAYLK